MGLPRALDAHKKGDLKQAALHYRRALSHGDKSEIIYQNFGSLLRDIGKIEKARGLYEEGLQLYPHSRGIRQNYANLLRPISPTSSLELELELLSELIASGDPLVPKNFMPVLEILVQLDCFHWAYQLSLFVLEHFAPGPDFLVLFFKIITDDRYEFSTEPNKLSVQHLIEQNLEHLEPLELAQFKFSVAWLQTERRDFSRAITNLRDARTTLKYIDPFNTDQRDKANFLNNVNSWNMANILLPEQDFKLGWELFEYGLCAVAKGPQKWQRALPKPFSHEELPLWRGESLASKSILLLEEQAIGDVMQFITLVPNIVRESKHVSLLISERLMDIYSRSLANYISEGVISIFSFKDVVKNDIESKSFDYQSPIGSICRYRFTDITLYGHNLPILVSDQSISGSLRSKYLAESSKKAIVGISWRGGGRDDRIKQKSITPTVFSELISGFEDVLFVSLQYGDVTDDVLTELRSSGASVIVDSQINALKDMDHWLSQVDACDAVLSVANTTIHGAGGLSKPTMCLLSQDSDWRWLKNAAVTRSYWYPSVAIAREDETRNWDNAFAKVRQWLSAGTPPPDGSQYIL